MLWTRLRPLLLATLVALAPAAGFARPGPAQPRPAARVQTGDRVPLQSLRPSQTELARASVSGLVRAWRAQARARGLRFDRFAARELRSTLAGQSIPVTVAPDGVVRALDAHHRIAALLEVERQTGVSFRLPVRVVKDYAGYSSAAYARHFVERLGKGYFRPALRALAPAERMRRLPARFGQLADAPLRAIVDAAFERLGLDPDHLRDYVEFRVTERLERAGLKEELRRAGALPHPGDERLPIGAVERVMARLREPAMLRYLAGEVRGPDHRATLGAQLEAIGAGRR